MTTSFHTYPVGEPVEFITYGDVCPCGPTREPVTREDGSTRWVVIHHSRGDHEHAEPDHDGATCPVCTERAA